MGDTPPSGARADAVAAQGAGAIGADCEDCCTMRLPRYTVFVRSFHPNAVFEETRHVAGWATGGPWSGDNRGFSLSSSVTSRVMHRYVADTAQMPRWFQTIRPEAHSDASHALGWGSILGAGQYPQNSTRGIELVQTSPYGRLYEIDGPQAHPDRRLASGGWFLLARTIPEAKMVRSDLLIDRRCRKSATVVTHHFGVNLAVPMSAGLAGAAVPDLDVFAKLTFDVDRSARTLDLETKVFGDQFPNCEAFLVDEANTRVFLGASRRIGYPVNWHGGSTLRGVGTRPMFDSALKFALDENGRLLRFAGGRSISDWNASITALDPNATTNPTSWTVR